jgi:hypothetical protein
MNGHVLYWASQTLWWLGWASVCGVGCGVLYTASKLWRSGYTGLSAKRASRTSSPMTIQAMTRLSALAAMFFLGFLYNDHLHHSQMYPFTKMEVLRKYDDYNYQVRFVDDMLPWSLHVCHDYKVSWDEGMTIVDGSYEDFGECKDFGVHGAWFKIQKDPRTDKFVDWRQYAER